MPAFKARLFKTFLEEEEVGELRFLEVIIATSFLSILRLSISERKNNSKEDTKMKEKCNIN